jgi:BirA family biotin operon repressor/biotin-[acetyl-CoA-carboxylase] ligase
VLGIGINVNIPPDQLPETAVPATSLQAAGGRSFSRLDLLADFLLRLENGYERAESGQSPQPIWRQRLITLGKQVQVSHSGTGDMIRGLAEDCDEYGRLLVRDGSGLLHTIAAGDVTLR